MRTALSFEKPMRDIEARIDELRRLHEEGGPDTTAEIAALEEKVRSIEAEIYSGLGAWDKVSMARHPDRPYTLDYAAGLTGDSFVEMHGDRRFGDDPAIVGGMALFRGRTVMILGHQKASSLKERQYRNFGMARPEGYRKATRLMKLADKLAIPVISFVDTPAADCSLGAESRGISESIARSMYEMSSLRVPVVITIIGEGGSGGAIGIAVGNHVMMLEHAIYSVIPPEGCAAILWKDSERADRAAEALKLTAQDALRLGVVDEIVTEPLGGAHRDPKTMIDSVGQAIEAALKELSSLSPDEIEDHRYRKFRAMGRYA